MNQKIEKYLKDKHYDWEDVETEEFRLKRNKQLKKENQLK
jgi:hypothetical protein